MSCWSLRKVQTYNGSPAVSGQVTLLLMKVLFISQVTKGPKDKFLIKISLCFRIEESDLDELSCTDIEQQWGALKSSSLKEYEAKKLTDLCHVKAKRDVYVSILPEVTKEMENKWREALTNCKKFS
ncbi:uncharacterized protein LOC127750921 [Frankliniella occidentalis]|uniref:Uncharacterized protein LOC127750921 n=1 Tax=Frankliniella occidentalis TaxID=133901 RepID=A0A9C6XSL1_FRAOC|nr:uncharacterized protein LOC127750921 [Frankliniella occidentalis]